MKKNLVALLFALMTFSIAFGQGKPEKKADKPKTEKAPKTKKDGTPDMRFKENKEKKAKPSGPLKKDGTPDMRHKANRDASKK